MDTDAINTLDEAVVAYAPLRVVRTCSFPAISPRQLHSSTTRKIDTLDDKGVYCARGCVYSVDSRRGGASGFWDSGYLVIELRTFWGFGAVDDARDIYWTRYIRASSP